MKKEFKLTENDIALLNLLTSITSKNNFLYPKELNPSVHQCAIVWKVLAEKHKIKWETAEPSTRGEPFFLAEPID